MKLYIDITNILDVAFFTGIPRVVTEVSLRMIDAGQDVCLLSYSAKEQCYRVIDNRIYCDCLRGKCSDKKACYTDKRLAVSELEPHSVFYDCNSCWHTMPNRSWLLPQLKNLNIRIVPLIHDIIPVTHPQYLMEQTRFRFMGFLLAHMKYADFILVTSKYVKADLEQLYSQLPLEPKPIQIVPLGADFSVKTGGEGGEISPVAKEIVARGRYTLTVGTVEPRKNHQVIVEAYENGIADTGVQVVFVGKAGWQVDDLLARMEANPNFNNGLYHLQGMNDATVQYLYQHAFLVIFPSFIEGFGLPTIEALIAGVPVLASDVPVMREVGGDFCDYFGVTDAKKLAALVQRYAADEQAYAARKAKVAAYQPPRWEVTQQGTCAALLAPDPDTLPVHKPLRQAVFLSARPAPFLETLPFVEAFMPFIEEVVVCCPAEMAAYLQENYTGNLQLTTITDDQLLNGRQLPADHSTRNFFLRCLAMQQDAIDEEFIMFDDDYRPLVPMTEEVFFKDGRYQAYYCTDIATWRYTVIGLYSYDYCHFRTLRFLREHGLATLQYSSHQPQVINKRWYQEMIERFPGIELQGLDEWSTYFNYCAAVHRANICVKPYVTMNWPNAGNFWQLGAPQGTYLFENFYAENYKFGRIFHGFSRRYHTGTAKENLQKIEMMRDAYAQYLQTLDKRQHFAEAYRTTHGEYPSVAIRCPNKGAPVLCVPVQLMLRTGQNNHIRVAIARDTNTVCNSRTIELQYAYVLPDGSEVVPAPVTITARQVNTGFNMLPPEELPAGADARLRLTCTVADTAFSSEQTIALLLTE